MADSRDSVIAGHDVTVSPSDDSYATLDLGAFLPNLRYPTDHLLGVQVVVGKTNLETYESLIERYALIASQPEGEVTKVSGLMTDMLIENAIQGAILGLAGPLVWIIVGPSRRRELVRAGFTRRSVALLASGGALAVVATYSVPFIDRGERSTVAKGAWEPIGVLLPTTPMPPEAQRIQIQKGLITSGTQRLIESAITSYNTSLTIYRDLATQAADLSEELRQPSEEETVALLVADRHDNVGMDPVARAIADAGGATILLDGGDDTSTGEAWESFSLDSLVEAFEDIDEKYQAPGNHDNGAYASDYLGDRGFTVLDGEPVETDEGIWLLGVPDPRSSGLGSWRTTSGITFEDQAARLAEVACKADASGERIATLLVHDSNMGDPALEAGCVDLVLAGHVHTQVGPDEVIGSNGQVGVTYTNGTTGGAAYAVAVGTKLRRDAQVTLVTYRDGQPVGLQPVTIKTNSVFIVSPYLPLEPHDVE